MYRLFLALRYLLSRPINLLGALGITLGVWAMIVVVSIFSGYLAEARKHIAASSSDLTALGLDAEWAKIADSIESDPSVAGAAPRIVWYALVHSGRGGARPSFDGTQSAQGIPGPDGNFVAVVGVDATAEARVTDFDAWVRAVEDPALRVADPARPLAPDGDLPSLLVSTERARAHGLAVGDTVELLSAATSNREDGLDVVDRRFRVAGCFASSFALFDGLHVFVDIAELRDMLGKPASWVNGAAIDVRDDGEVVDTGYRLERTITALLRQRVLVRSGEGIHENDLLSIDHQRSLMTLVLFVIMVVAAFLVFATLSMMVTEKTRDIGILTALGASSRGVATVFLLCGAVVSLFGAVAGVAAGCVSAVYTDAFNLFVREVFDVDLFPTAIYHLTHVPCELDPLFISVVAGAAVGLGVVVSAVPAWRAARHDPLQSLRED